MIEAVGLRKAFGNVRAVDGASFEAPDGLVTGLLGPNGAGKTTTLRLVGAILRPDEGSARVDGLDSVRDSRRALGRLGVLPESRGLYPRLTARENIRYFGRLHGLRGAALEEAIEDLVRILDMQDLADRRTQGFSTGERVKVALARALVHRPRNVILDEPTAGLDVMSTRAMRDFVRRLRDDGCCVLFSSHIMQEVSALCDRIVIMAGGRVVAAGTPEAIRLAAGRDSLEDAFVAAIGSAEGLEP